MILPTILISASRIFALTTYYHAPLDIAYDLQYRRIPEILLDAGYKPIPPPPGYEAKQLEQGYNPEWDFTVLTDFDPPIRVCYGKEWYTFPGSYLIPEGIEVNWIKSDFDGMLPMRWDRSLPSRGLWKRERTRAVHPGRFNDRNEENPDAYVSVTPHPPPRLSPTSLPLGYLALVIHVDSPGLHIPPPSPQVDISECTFLVDSTLPSQSPTPAQPAYTRDTEHWERVFCTAYLDAASTPWWARILYLPGERAKEARVWGEYCLLRNKNL